MCIEHSLHTHSPLGPQGCRRRQSHFSPQLHLEETTQHAVQGPGRPAADRHPPGADRAGHRIRTARSNWPSDKGLYFLDTRLISAWAIYANGEPWDLLNGGAITYDTARIFLTNRSFLTEDGAVPARSLGFVIGRRLGGGMHEDLDITNHGPEPVRFNLEIAIRSDFADVFEVKSNRIVRRGRITTDWSDAHQKLRTTYRNQDFLARGAYRHAARGPARRLRQRPAELRGADRSRHRPGIAACSTT